MTTHPRRVAPLLFVSGFCALVYQISWLREFRLVFGASTAASAAVLAIFIGGLGAGGFLIGGRADRHPRPLGLYARLEALIALSAALTPALLWLVREAYVSVGGTAVLGPIGGTALRLILTAIVLGLPTWLMGGTLPAAARAVAGPEDPGRRGVALLYGVNTLGAVTGAFVGTFFMLELFGTRQTLWLACLINLLVAVVAGRMARTLPSASGERGPIEAEPVASSAPASFVLVAAAVVGFAFFLMELVWYRMLGPILGGSIYTFGLILSVALLGIGLGGAAFARFHADRRATVSAFAYTCLLEAALIALPYLLGDRLAVLSLVLRPLGQVGLFWGQVAAWTVVCFLVVLPAAVVAGYQFPMLISLLGQGSDRVGRQVGLAYACNTAGAIAGSLAGGFGLLPLLSAPGTWRFATLLLVVQGVAAAALDLRAAQLSARRVVAPLALAGATLLMLAATGPTAAWRHSAIGAGRAAVDLGSPNALEWWLRYHRRIVQWEADGVESSVALEAIGPGYAFVINGKIDGNTRGDAPTMIMAGMLGAALHPRPERAMVIGLGTGGSAGWLGSVPTIERLDVIELEPLLLRVARDCAPINQGVMDNPKVRITLGDAREALLVSKESYDLIASEPSNPFRAGIASLFTREYYQAAARRLRPGGLFVQWVQAYEVDGQTVATIYATLSTVFPAVETWQVSENDLVLVASAAPLTHDVPRLRSLLRQEPYRSAIHHGWRADSLEGFLARHVAGPSLGQALAARGRRWINTDDHNLVEFGFARTVGESRLTNLFRLRELAILRNEDLPAVAGGPVDWEQVADGRVVLYPPAVQVPQVRDRLGSAQRLLAGALERFAARDGRGALEAWRALDREPRSLVERTLVAWALADTGDSRATALIDSIRPTSAAEADALLALLQARQGRAAEAARTLEAALVANRRDPWPHLALVQGAMDLAVELAHQQPALAPSLFEAVRTPFVLKVLDDQRMTAAVQLLSKMDPGPACSGFVRSIEPHVRWDHEWLSLRHRCYAATGDPNAARAKDDLDTFLRREPEAFRVTIGGNAP